MNKYRCQICGGTSSFVRASKVKDWEHNVPGEYEYRECAACGQTQIEPFPTLDDLIKAYPEDYPCHMDMRATKGRIYIFLFGIHASLSLRKLKHLIKPEARIIDVGCGNGYFLNLLRSAGFNNLVGIDFNETSVRLCQAKGLKVVRGLFPEYQAEPASFDVIVMNNYLEHVLNPIAELRKARLLLRPGGIFFGGVPNLSSLDQKIFGRFWGGFHAPRHTFLFSENQLKKLLVEAGFSSVEIVHNINPGVVRSVQNFLQNFVDRLRGNSGNPIKRMEFDFVLLTLLWPLHAIFAILRQSCSITFYAKG